MRVISNILWIILGGLIIAIGWALIGLVLCVTIIGIPLGLQAFKMAGLTLTPFGKTVRYGGGVGSTLANTHLGRARRLLDGAQLRGRGLLNCITIIGIPFGIQSFKMANWRSGRSARTSSACERPARRLIRRSAYTVPSSR